MATLQTCKQQLTITLQKNPNLKASLSQLTSQARGNSRTDCINEFGQGNDGSTALRTFISSINTKNSQQASTTHNASVSTGNSRSMMTIPGIQQGWIGFKSIFRDVLLIIGLVILGIFVYKVTKYLLAFIYDVMNASRIVYLKILLPRGDDKISKEQSKEVAKDMKEKIGRIGQVFDNIYKLGDISFMDNIMLTWFHKPKVTLILSYEKTQVSFIVAVYPEYQKLLEGAISAQFADASIELTYKPKFRAKKYHDITVLEKQKESVYPIKTFKTMQDDPLNNILDALGKINGEDVFNIIIPLKPYVGSGFTDRAKILAEALYKKNKSIIDGTPRWKYIIMPRKILDFLIYGPSKEMLEKANDDGGNNMIRMLKTEEEAINVMGEEANQHPFVCGIILTTSSDDPKRSEENINNVIGSFTVFEDNYNNKLDENNWNSDILGFFFKPLWRFAADFLLPQFFFKQTVMTPSQLGSIFHFPDGNFNRSPAIKWMEYKVLAGPENLPTCSQDSGFIMTGVVAEEYKKGVISDILQEKYPNHRAVGTKIDTKEELKPIETVSEADQAGKEVVEKDGKRFVKFITEKKVRGYKIFKEGVLLGINIYRNVFSPVYIKRNDRTRHHYIIGKSGGGKSVYIGSLARQDVWNGDGLCVIDPHGDLVEGILEYIPKERAQDVIFFDAGNEDRPMGLNLYEIEHIDQADRTVNDATEIFIKMFGSEIFGPRIQEYFKYASLTLLEDFEDPPTLLDVPRVFTDENYRALKTKNIKNAVVKNFREKTYAAMGDREKQEIIPYFTSKFVSFNTNRLIRNVIGQTKSGFRFRKNMDEGKIILISLSKGKIGEINAQLLGMIIVSQIYNAAMSRANIPEKDRRDFYLYVDEFQNFVSGTFADILSEARKYRLGLIMAHQYIAQLESGSKSEGGKGDVKAAVFGNVGTMQSFKVGAPDAEFLEKEYAPVLSAQDIIGIANYKAYIKLNINSTTSRVFSMNTIWTQDYQSSKIAKVLIEYSAKKYGRERKFVDAEIEARLGVGGASEETLSDTPPADGDAPVADTTPTEGAGTDSTASDQTTA